MHTTDKRKQVRISMCRSSYGISVTAMIIVAVLELVMLGYTFANAAMYGSFLWIYRTLYIVLLAVAVIYLIMSLYVKGDIEHRYRWMDFANPLCASLFYAWSIAVTYTDFVGKSVVYNVVVVDPTVFMTFSMVVPLSFYMRPGIYGSIVAIADALMFWIILRTPDSVGLIINSCVFFVFQIVLGINYLRMKQNVAERIVKEQAHALIDVLTGCRNRRAYEAEIGKLKQEPLPGDLTYIAMDLDGLKEINDSRGHEAGDRLIVGAALCVKKSIGDRGQVFRIGGDEFAVLLHAEKQEVEAVLAAYRDGAEAWSKENDLTLSASYGYACAAELPDGTDILELARKADGRMYETKAEHYRTSGNDRRKQAP